MNWKCCYICGPRGPLSHGVEITNVEAATTEEAWRLAVEQAPAESFQSRNGCSAQKFGTELLTRMIPQHVKSPEIRLETTGVHACGRRSKVSVKCNIQTVMGAQAGYDWDREIYVIGTGEFEFFCTGQVGGDSDSSFEWCGRTIGSDPIAEYIRRKSKLKEIDRDFITICEWGKHHFHTQFTDNIKPDAATIAQMEQMIKKYSR